MSRARPFSESAAFAFNPPDAEGFIDPFGDKVLAAYLKSVRQWHGYIRFVGLPKVRSDLDVTIDELFVEPRLPDRHVLPDTDPAGWPKAPTALDTLAERPRLVVLGDPGSGKSTLVNWLAWQLARREPNPCATRLGRLIPVPVVLRDLPIGPRIDWPGLLDAFLGHEMAQPLGLEETQPRDRLEAILQRGQALVMLDGLDEISSVAVRQALARAVHEGIRRYPACRWLMTSRIVGYEAVAFDKLNPDEEEAQDRAAELENTAMLDNGLEDTVRAPIERPPSGPRKRRKGATAGLPSSASEDSPKNTAGQASSGTRAVDECEPEIDAVEGPEGEQLEWLPPGHRPRMHVAEVRYVAPFDDRQVDEFVLNWFARRDSARGRAQSQARELIEAIRRDPSTLKLARIPNLLTMMALIFRDRARLPHGRALLYNEIADAYLESIDEYRRLKELDYPLDEKKNWLARVGFEMQRRRGEREEKKQESYSFDKESAGGEILVDGRQLRAWIAGAMDDSGRDRDATAAAAFVDYLGRRSGLLLPRGQDRFAFMHLSIQEYFAAFFLGEEITSPRWLIGGQVAPDCDRESLRRLARVASWRETLVFLFELLAQKSDWSDTLVEVLFGKDFAEIVPEKLADYPAAVLLAQLAVDPHSGLGRAARAKALEHCCRVEASWQAKFAPSYEPLVARALFAAEADQIPQVSKALAEAMGLAGARVATYGGCAVSCLTPLAALQNLKALYLDQTQVADLTPLATMENLKGLLLNQTQVVDLAPLATMKNLKWLSLNQTRVIDLTPLATMKNLKLLYLDQTQVVDLTPLAALKNLKLLSLDQTPVTNEQIESFHAARRAAGLQEVVIHR